MSLEKLEQIAKKMEHERIKYGQIQTYFQGVTDRHRIRNPKEMDEVVKQLQESAGCLARFRKEYDDLMIEVSKIIMENQNE
jgi:hypothetical protein